MSIPCQSVRHIVAAALYLAASIPYALEAADSGFVCHVALDGNDENDGATWATAKATVTNAMATCATSGATIEIGEGTFPVQKTLALSTNLRIIGQGAGVTVLDFGGACRGATMTHDSAVLCDLTISNGVATYSSGGGINMSKGTVRRCRITSCRTAKGTGSAKSSCGGGIYMTGGMVADSEIDHCYFYGGNNFGNGIDMTGGVVTNCDIHSNNNSGEMTYQVVNHCAAVSLRSGSPLLVDSRIHDNVCICAPGLFVKAGTVDRCHVYGNIARQHGSSNTDGHGGAGLEMSGGTVRNCLFAGNDSGTYTDSRYQPGTGGVNMSAGTLAYCTIAANANVNDTVGRKGLAMSGGTAVGNIFWGNTGNNMAKDVYVTAGTFTANLTGVTEVTSGTGNFVDDPRFTDFANGDYTLRHSSPCIDKGPTLAWMANSMDLAGNPRVYPLRNGLPDLGCYECLFNKNRRTIFSVH